MRSIYVHAHATNVERQLPCSCYHFLSALTTTVDYVHAFAIHGRSGLIGLCEECAGKILDILFLPR